jgi:predicted metal-dependent HD superfamily phosphohydrolase
MSRTEAPEWLAAVWSRALVEAGSTAPDGEIARMGAKLVDRWSNPARHFHGIGHLITVLEKIDELAQETCCPSLVRLAAFYHGAILSASSDPLQAHAWSEDEALSATLARGQLQHLGLPEDKIERVFRLITDLGKRPTSIENTDLAVLCDAERAILAADPRAYRAYAKALRAECGDEPPELILRGRIAVLQAWLTKEKLFVTPSTASWEDVARNNIEAELSRSERELAALSAPALHPSAGLASAVAANGSLTGSFD